MSKIVVFLIGILSLSSAIAAEQDLCKKQYEQTKKMLEMIDGGAIATVGESEVKIKLDKANKQAELGDYCAAYKSLIH